MTMKLNRITAGITASLAVTGLLLLAGCAGTPQPPKRSGFLYNYSNLHKVDDTTWRYINTNRLALYSKFVIAPVKVTVTEFEGKPITAEQKDKAAAYIRESLTKAIESKGYKVVPSGYGDVAEVRTAITDIYKSGNQLGLTVEGSIVDNASAYQAAAVMKTELAPAQLGNWWDGERARSIIDSWSERMAEAIVMAHNTAK